jgi:3-hydroxy-9,10-secoandrosta-1,3,5(10)-triene-9,17-dione monooxygenase
MGEGEGSPAPSQPPGGGPVHDGGSAGSAPKPPAPTRDDCVDRARRLAPRLAERAERTEAARRLLDETVADLVESGLVRTLLPRRYGGAELDFDLVLGVCLELGRACASTAWVGSFFINHAWVVGLFPRAAQDEVWAADPDALVATRVSFGGSTARRVSGGVLLSGVWPQTSGVDHAGWMALCAERALPAGGAETLFCLVPRGDVRIQDTWFASGLRGSGSHTVLAEGVFVPDHRTIQLRDFLDGTCPGGQAPGAGPLYRLPASGGYMPILAGPIVGAALGALSACAEASKRVRGGPGSLGPAHQVTLATAAADIDGAALLLHRHFQEAMATVAAGEQMTLEERARGRRDGAYAARVCNRALTHLLDSAPASVLYDASPVQRAFRDVRVMAAHPALNLDTVGELWTSVAYDLPLPPCAGHAL